MGEMTIFSLLLTWAVICSYLNVEARKVSEFGLSQKLQCSYKTQISYPNLSRQCSI